MNKVEICGVVTSQLPKLSQSESTMLLEAIKRGDKDARERFLLANMRLVLSIVGRFRNRADCADDLFQVGYVGLVKALDNFNTAYNVRFSTYAVPMIIGEIKRFLRDRNSIKVSRSMRDTAYKALRTKEELSSKIGNFKEPDLVEIAEEMNVPISEVACALDAVSETVSFYEPVYSDGDDAVMLLDTIADTDGSAENWAEHISLRDGIEKLPEKEREVLLLRYYYGKTQIEISNLVGISQAQVSRTEKSALEKLRKSVA